MSDSMGEAVFQAARDGNEAELRRLIGLGGSVNWRDGVRRRMCLAWAPASSSPLVLSPPRSPETAPFPQSSLYRARRRKQQRRRGRGRPREAHAAAHLIRMVPVDVPSKADQPRELRFVAVPCGLAHGLAHRVAHRVQRLAQQGVDLAVAHPPCQVKGRQAVTELERRIGASFEETLGDREVALPCRVMQS